MKGFKLLFVLLVLSVLAGHAAENRKHIIISGQDQFDALDATIKRNLSQGVTELTVTLQKGLYRYGEKHLDLSSLNYPKANIILEGEAATLVAKDLGREHTWQDGSFDQQSLADIDRWNPLEQSPREVEVIDAEQKLCRIRTATRQRRLKASQCQGLYLNLTMWYDSKVYPIERCESCYIYFTANDLEYSKQFGCWNVNYDVMYGKINPRYRTIFPVISSIKKVGYCQASTFANLWHSSVGSFTLRGITFGPNNAESPLIATDQFKSRQLLIENCSFRGVRGVVIKVWFTDNVEVRSNTFEGCYYNGVESYSGCKKTHVIGNTFRNHGKGMRQNFGVICRGQDFLVENNMFRNFSYSAIGVGVWYGNKPQGPVTGTVRSNDIGFDQDFYEDYFRHTLMDGGAIYTWTLCDRVTIQNNKINRYRGIKDYRGIFCDDGGKNITVRGNTVTNIGGGSWCIDLRWVEQVGSKVPDHNTGNDVSDNKVDGRVRFETAKP